MQLSTNMRDALIRLIARSGGGEDVHAQTMDALVRRGLAEPAPEEGNGARFVETDLGREVLAEEFRRRREAMPAPPEHAGSGTYWTRERFAPAIGVTTTAVYLWESGRRPIQPITWAALDGLEARLWIRYRLRAALEEALSFEISGTPQDALDRMAGHLVQDALGDADST